MSQREKTSRSRACLRLLGGWQLTVNGSDLRLSHREQRLAAFLGLSGERARPHVAGQLWPDSTDERALASLRRAVMQTQHACPGLLRVDRAFVGLDPEIEVDVAQVRRAAEVSELPESHDQQSHLVTLLTGEELLPGWYDDWVLAERESLQQMRLRALDRISREALDQEDMVLAIEAARSASTIEPHSEAACEVALRAHLSRGDLGSALSEFRRYRGATWDNVGAAPSDRILALVESAVGATDLGDASPAPVGSPAATVPASPAARPAVAPLPSHRTRPPGPHVPRLTPAVMPEVTVMPDVTVTPEVTVTPAVRATPAYSAAPEGLAPGHNARVVAGLAGAAVLLLAVSLVVAVGGPDRARAGSEASPPTPGASGSPGRLRRSPDGREVLDRVGQQLDVQPAGVLPGGARFTLSASSLPASVQLTIRNASGPLVVRTLQVTSRAGRRVELDGLPAGWSQWKATSPDVDPVSGRVWVPPSPSPSPTAAPPTAEAAPPPRPTPTAQPDPQPSAQPSPTPQPSPTAQPSPQPSPTPQPSPDPEPSPTPHPSPSPSPQPSPQPSPTAQPTDPGTVAPPPVG